MEITCPNCQEALEIEPARWQRESEGLFGSTCPLCQAVLQVALRVGLGGKEVQVRPTGSPATNEILVAVDGEATRDLIGEVLQKAGYKVLHASTGRQALNLLGKQHPPIAILDVGLPQMFGFEVCDVIKRNETLKFIKVILVAAIHDKTSYRREPKTLYGADEYIERHDIQVGLLPKIGKLLQDSSPDWIPAKAVEAEQPAQAQPQGDSRPTQKTQSATAGVSPEHEAARRLARIIVSDIALYNADRVKEAVEKKCFHEMLKVEIDEGHKLYNERVPADVRTRTDYFHEEIENYIRKVRPQ